MKLARVTGTVEATVKNTGLTGQKLLLTDLVDGNGKLIEPAVVAIDDAGAGVGDLVLITCNAAARIPSGLAGKPVDAAIIGIIDRVNLASQGATTGKK